MSNVVIFPTPGKVEAVEYSVLFTQTGRTLEVKIFGAGTGDADTLAIAGTFEKAAQILRDGLA